MMKLEGKSRRLYITPSKDSSTSSEANAKGVGVKFELEIGNLGVSLISLRPEEILYASASNVVLDVAARGQEQLVSFTIDSAQIDNQLRNAIFPIVLHRKVEGHQEEDKKRPVFEFSFAHRMHDKVVFIQYLSATLGELDVEIDGILVSEIVAFLEVAVADVD